MAIQIMKVKINGIAPLLMNNPQTVDPFNRYSILKKPIVAKRTKKTDEDILELRKIEMESKLYLDDEHGVYIPSSWIDAFLASGTKIRSFTLKDVRGGIFVTEDKLKLSYDGESRVSSKSDISMDEHFTYIRLVKMGMVKLAKAFPIFHNWSFECELEYEDSIVNGDELKDHIEYNAKYGGFGDFRPKFGRAIAEVEML